jgi:hypothetical protein
VVLTDLVLSRCHNVEIPDVLPAGDPESLIRVGGRLIALAEGSDCCVIFPRLTVARTPHPIGMMSPGLRRPTVSLSPVSFLTSLTEIEQPMLKARGAARRYRVATRQRGEPGSFAASLGRRATNGALRVTP